MDFLIAACLVSCGEPTVVQLPKHSTKEFITQDAAASKVQGPVMWDAIKKVWVPSKGKPAAQAAARVPDIAAPVSRDEEGYHTSTLPTLRSEDELAAYQKDLAAKAKVKRYPQDTLALPDAVFQSFLALRNQTGCV